MQLGSALAWTTISVVVKNLIRVVSNLTLARMLLPEVYGIAATVFVAVQAIELLTDAGVAPSLVRGNRTDDDWLNTAWTVQFARGIFISIMALLISFPIAWFYGESSLQPMIAVGGLISLVAGFNSTVVVLAMRNLNLKSLAIAEIIASLVSLPVMLGLAWISPNAWVLVLGALSSATTLLVLSWFWLNDRVHQVRLEPSALREFARVGKWLLLGTALGLFLFQFDRLIIGKSLGFRELGIYFVAFTWAGALLDLVSKFTAKLYLPIVSEMARRDGHSRGTLLIRKMISESLVIPFACAAGASVPLIQVLYPERLWEAGAILQLMIIASWFSLVETIYNFQFIAEGHPNRKPFVQVISLVYLAVGLLVLYWYGWVTLMSITILFVGAAIVRAVLFMALYYRRNYAAVVPEALSLLLMLVLTLLITMFYNHFAKDISNWTFLVGLTAVAAAPTVLLIYRATIRMKKLLPMKAESV